jgi:hypothetical protein
MRDPEKPYYHVAPINGRLTVFANLEYPADEPPKTIEVDGHVWVLREEKKQA